MERVRMKVFTIKIAIALLWAIIILAAGRVIAVSRSGGTGQRA